MMVKKCKCKDCNNICEGIRCRDCYNINLKKNRKTDWDNIESVRERNTKYHQGRKNSPEVKAKIKNYQEKNKKELKQYRKRYYEKNKGKIKVKGRKYREEHKKEREEYQKKYREKNKEEAREYQKRYRENSLNKIKRKVYMSTLVQKEKKKIRGIKYSQKLEVKERRRKRNNSPRNIAKRKTIAQTPKEKVRRKKYNQQSHRKIIGRLRSRLSIALKSYTNNGKVKTSDKYGVNYNKIMEYLKPFPQDLSKYHIDHIKPLCKFNFINKDGTQNLEEIKRANAPENHQWLSVETNLSKGGKWGTEEQIKYLLF